MGACDLLEDALSAKAEFSGSGFDHQSATVVMAPFSPSQLSARSHDVSAGFPALGVLFSKIASVFINDHGREETRACNSRDPQIRGPALNSGRRRGREFRPHEGMHLRGCHAPPHE
eukprot:gnl/Chilomastix_cuspidata/7438.p9 GENE.gnl/Chilomastix_cuspidata/7438~~gnl/Chilomastix_cuspidata/7438.p9  ORF type:complete len:116 (+),score=9.26 gnl/Chilomastix_cuspidata/7438:2340-2687(+)